MFVYAVRGGSSTLLICVHVLAYWLVSSRVVRSLARGQCDAHGIVRFLAGEGTKVPLRLNRNRPPYADSLVADWSIGS